MPAISPTGTEFLVNTTTENAQAFSNVAALQNGGYIITWSSMQPDVTNDVFAQRYDSDGSPVGSEFLVNSTTVSWQSYPQVTTLADGSFVIIWQSGGFGMPDGNDVMGQRYDANGVPIAGEFQINTHVALDQDSPVITALDSGGFVVAWESRDQEGVASGDGIYAQQFDANGLPVGGEFLVNTHIDDQQSAPSISSLADGGYMITWESKSQDPGTGVNNYGIYGQRYNADGVAVGGEFRINTTVDGLQRDPHIVGLANGGFIVAWEEGDDGSYMGVSAQLFGADGNPVGDEFLVNTTTRFPQHSPTIAAMGDGGFIVVWVDSLQDTFAAGIFAQRYDANGVAIGPETQINTYTDKNQDRPTITVLEDGGFVISWTSFEQDGGATGVYAQQFEAQLFGTKDGDELSDTVGADWMHGRMGDDTLYGLDGNDLILGGAGEDTLYGGIGDDSLKGNKDNDTLYGGAGNDRLIGGAGDDILVGGADKDMLKGGAGADTFVFNEISDSVAGANDRIKDFEIGIDQIDLSALIPGTFTFVEGEAFSGTGAEILAVQKNGNTFIRVDVDGDGAADMRIFVSGTIAFSETDFIL